MIRILIYPLFFQGMSKKQNMTGQGGMQKVIEKRREDGCKSTLKVP